MGSTEGNILQGSLVVAATAAATASAAAPAAATAAEAAVQQQPQRPQQLQQSPLPLSLAAVPLLSFFFSPLSPFLLLW